MTKILGGVVVALALAAVACGRPNESGLRDSFAQQLAANRFITDFQRSGDDLTFSGPGPEGGSAKWRVHIDAASIDDNSNEAQPYKGTIRSSWYANGQKIEPRGADSNLPIELTSNGLSNGECWAFWEKAGEKWSWE